MRINVNNDTLPGVQSEDEFPTSFIKECAIYQDGEYIGAIVNTKRETAKGTVYGWRPEKAAAQSKLTSKVDAIRRLPKFVAKAGA